MHNLELLLAQLKDDEREAALDAAASRARFDDEVTRAAALLLFLGYSSEAERLVIEKHEYFSTAFYGSSLELIKRFIRAERPAAAAIIYRGLIWEILNAERYKAYPHAAKYYKKLHVIDAAQDIYPVRPRNVQRNTTGPTRQEEFVLEKSR